ncbi:MAG TPA: gamma-glutamyltransferase, partial [Pyrinomonadaceae bacterium]|nr:gamma-glutamyltransferase [Pyrinomonadaceae bacterium]
MNLFVHNSPKKTLLNFAIACAIVCAQVSSPSAFARNAAAATTAAPALLAAPGPLRARHGMVASTSEIASRVGVDILRRGGNAVDAAVAVAFALAVVYPAAGNLGGGGFMLIRLRDGRATAIDYREMAPARATRDLYLDREGRLISGEGSSTLGYRAAGVPGTVAGMDLALKKYGSGKLTWAQLIEPARRLAARGFTVSHSLAGSLKGNADTFELYRDSRRILLGGGRFYAEGDQLIQIDLARTFARLQRGGPREFYEGRTAQMIAADMARHNGLMTLEDLRGYIPKERLPVRGSYRGHEIISMPPPSSGGAVLLEMLNILEGYELRNLGWSSSARYHLTAEAMRRAFADRAAYLGDADFIKVPVTGMIDKAYAARQRESIDRERASTSREIKAGQPAGYESTETTHFTVIDAAGNAVSNTYTLNDSYGAKVIAEGTGVLLNNEMDDFT